MQSHCGGLKEICYLEGIRGEESAEQSRAEQTHQPHFVSNACAMMWGEVTSREFFFCLLCRALGRLLLGRSIYFSKGEVECWVLVKVGELAPTMDALRGGLCLPGFRNSCCR